MFATELQASTQTHPATRPAALLTPAPQPVMSFAEGTSLYEEGDEATGYYRLVSGVVRTCRFAQDGRRHIDAFYMPGDVFGFELTREHGFTAEAVTDCVVIPCRRRGAEEPVHDGAAAQQLYGYAMQQLARAQAHAQLLGRYGAAQRLAGFLLELSAGKNPPVVELPMSRQDIADYLGLTIETVSRALAQLQKDGVVKLLAARRIEVKNRAALAEICG
jgi:CRP/FNR family transcriptional regulator, nitrogen fixation regulation protein